MLQHLNITEEDKLFARRTVLQFRDEKTPEQIFYELCFAICAPQTTFKSNLKVSAELMSVGFFKNDISKEELEEIVKPTRFFRNKSRYLMNAKENFHDIYCLVKSNYSCHMKRLLLVDRVPGLGMKAASHFLRNMGYNDLAIIDTHVLKFLDCQTPKSKREYTEIEHIFFIVAESIDLTVAELDAIVWKYYSGTDWKDFIH
jgi:N-glycosylase/DNA lyase